MVVEKTYHFLKLTKNNEMSLIRRNVLRLSNIKTQYAEIFYSWLLYLYSFGIINNYTTNTVKFIGKISIYP